MDKTMIDWCDSTWNPVTGCLHGCKYCYARSIANRFKERKGYELNEDNIKITFAFDGRPPIYEVDTSCFFERLEDDLIPNPNDRIKAPYPYGFAPTLHRYKLDEYAKKSGKNIFVCSMADLFGAWVPDEWIVEVFAACEKAPQHNYLFLTKNPKRYDELGKKGILPDSPNMWFGFSQTETMNKSIYIPVGNMFVSIEPILKETDPYLTNWVIIGAETGRRKDKVIPKREWIEKVLNVCRKHGIPIFMKSSLADIWGEPLIQEFPKGLERK